MVEFAPRESVITGGFNQSKQLLLQLRAALQRAESIDIIVSFLMESGVKLLLEDFRRAVQRGARFRFLTGTYLGITQPSALYLVKKELGKQVDLRLYKHQEQSFHPKAYIFRKAQGGELFIGSSNISYSALTSGIEWNYRIEEAKDQANFQHFCETFDQLFQEQSIIVDDAVLKDYAEHWHSPKDLAHFLCYPRPQSPQHFEPRGVQIEALYALAETRAEGADRALIEAATGVGKTCIAAFDSKDFTRILFVAHREEILRQAAKTFSAIRSTQDFGFFTGEEKSTQNAMIFASVATLGKEEYLHYFERDAFDYLIIDEFHHAVNSQYLTIIDYFQPKFLLGLTATPERLDRRDIYAICRYTLAYSIPLARAINVGVLVPFHYYAVYDETDYSAMRFVRGQYQESELEKLYLANELRFRLIAKHYKKYHSKRALGFCCSRLHAEAMAKDFCRRGIPAAAVHTGKQKSDVLLSREEALLCLEEEKIKVIFSVDIFNEGVDLPKLDMVMFLRPTESPSLFLQQLGRGLRRSEGKSYLTVLDFIGNYKNASRVLDLLSGSSRKGFVRRESDYPDDCRVDIDISLIDLFEEMDRRSSKTVSKEFKRVMDCLGKRPTRFEFFMGMEESIYTFCRAHSKENPFRDFFRFLKVLDLLSPEEEALYETEAWHFLHFLETTSMTKVYKMPVLLALYNDGQPRLSVTREELLLAWKQFFGMNRNWRDLKSEYADFLALPDVDHLALILKNPVHFLQKTGANFFIEREGKFSLVSSLEPFIKNPSFVAHMGDIIQYRTMAYYKTRQKGVA